MTTADKIKVMQAYADGKEIEFFDPGVGLWLPARTPRWNWVECEYRTKKREPRTFYLTDSNSGEEFTVREVLGDEI